MLYKLFLQTSNHIKTIFLQFYILQFFLQFHYSTNFLEIVLFVWYCETKLNIVFITYYVFLPLILLSSLSVMMNFEELIKTAICEVMLRNSNKSYFKVYRTNGHRANGNRADVVAPEFHSFQSFKS